ncbi:hypothetical protein WR25_02531 [Diploscapter pachys]|uniref:FATC domain-containing protein n=1 Tax=Diploscapter pachys TaxID=2018661 RepID=A0A2A2KU79_9BILA|nr:hypothetical protein WR25_02531 [Diploscapter pachys]
MDIFRVSPNSDSPINEKQEQNAHAKSLMRKVRQRLEGRVASTGNELVGTFGNIVISTDEQSGSLIRHATSLTLLAQMYEGWTAWV